MSIYKATYINKKKRNGYRYNEPQLIKVDRIRERKLQVISRGLTLDSGSVLKVYDNDEEFLKDWLID